MTTPMVRRILITNDDGINAPGLARLEKIARNLAEEVWVVAPEHDRSSRHIVAPDSDVAVLRDRAIAITPLRHEAPLPGETKEFDLSAMLAD
ncbi:5'/3'-nucleotidase SurE [Marinobacter sp.]|uniref:5'/3'-nucleotidase SurE n=1 Tax=Marinobacter sp. TaxID=50741 RepID=UPI003A911F47